MKIVTAQLNPVVGAVAENTQAMLQTIALAKAQQAQMVVFSELVVPGYPPKDLLSYPDFIEACLAANQALIAASSPDLLLVWGNIAENTTGFGKRLHNAGYVAWRGQLVAVAHKALLPTYDVFDEARYFEPAVPQQAVPTWEAFGQRFALTICEDLWSHPCFTPEETAQITPVQYRTAPLQVLRDHPVDVLINISASPYVLGKPALRFNLLKRLAAAEHATLVYTNQVGANDDLIFDGHSSITTPTGEQWQAPGFVEYTQVVAVMPLEEPQKGLPQATPEQELISAIPLGIRDYVQKTGFQKVFIGLSGGIDSSLTAVLAQRALGAQNVVGIAMPGPYSSRHSLEDAQLLAQNLGIAFRVYSINTLFDAFLMLLGQDRPLLDLAEQNLQARLRGMILMTLSNRENGLVLATGNKSEMATGFTTLYGDSCGALAPLGDVLKTQVYALAEAINQEVGWSLIPGRVLEKPPAAELAPNQVDADTLPPYPMLDKILQAFLEDQVGFGDLLRLGYDNAYVSFTLKRVMQYEYKRQQMPPTLKVSRKAFGSGRVFPIVQRMAFPLAGSGATTGLPGGQDRISTR